jgi:cobalt/nickel transport system permease protein
VINYVRVARPEILQSRVASRSLDPKASLQKVMIVFFVLTAFTGGALSWFASTHPDGLEWSIERITGRGELPEPDQGIVPALKRIQEWTAFLPDYQFKPADEGPKKEEATGWPGIDPGTSAAGILGAGIVLVMIVLIGMGIRSFRKRET